MCVLTNATQVADTMCTGVCQLSLFNKHMCLFTHASYGNERASEFHSRYGEGSMSHDRLVLGGMCPKHAYTCFSQTNRIQQPEGRGVGGPPTDPPRRGNSGRCRSTAYKNQHEPIGHMLSCTQTTLQREQALIVFQKRPGNLPSPREISCVWLGQCSLQWGWFPERVADPTECKHSLVPSSEVPC